MNSVVSTCVERSMIGLVGARRALGPLLGLTLLVSGCRGCSYHAHSEWHAGSGSSGGEQSAEPRQPSEGESTTRSTHRRSPGGRDNVVRVTGDGNKSQGGQGTQSGGGDAPERTVVRPTGDVPPSSSGSSGQGAAGEGARGASGDGSAAAGASGDSTGRGSEPAAPAAPEAAAEPAGSAPAEQAPETDKTTNKNPSEPHVTTPTHRKPRKVHRDGATNKEGRRE